MTDPSILQRIDHEAVNSAIFFPRPDSGLPAPPGSEEIRVPVGDEVTLAARYHPSDPAFPTVLHFHGNGEIVADYDDLAPVFHAAGASLLSVDYRGYGLSTGTPSVRCLIEDAPIVLDYIVEYLRKRRHTGPLVVMGRSLGSAPAIELAATRSERLAGLIVESGFAQTLPLLALFGISREMLGLPDMSGLDNEDKMADVVLPVLILHAAGDSLLPPWNAERLHGRAASRNKRLVTIPNADHNTIMAFGGDRYWGAVEQFLQSLEDRNAGSPQQK